ncbi:SpoIIE family protein phosphatase [Streptomyces sp. NPDC048664]|uniref:ATP-binding SpoIIE family protein phosphatase n=1 Tax=Streptomyces sp. NPDC048664 TaxID=3154505 RepID=UPI003422E340
MALRDHRDAAHEHRGELFGSREPFVLGDAHGAGDPFGITAAALVLVDAHGLIRYWSRRAEALLGHPAARVIGRPAGFLLAGEDAAASALSGARRVGEGWEGVSAALHSAGHRVELAFRACPLRTEDGDSWLIAACEVSASFRWEVDHPVLWGVGAEPPPDALTAHGDLPVLLPCRRQDGPGAGTAGRGDRDRTGPRGPLAPATAGERRGAARSGPASSGPPKRPAEDRARERLASLGEAGHRIGTTLDLDRTVCELAEVLVPRLADFVAVDLFQGVLAALELTPGRLVGGSLLRAAHLSVREDLPEVVVAVGEPAHYREQSPQWRCVASGGPIHDPVLDEATWWLQGDPVRREKLRALGVHTHLTVPLTARGVPMGVVTLMRWENPDPFDEDDLLLVEEVVARAAICVDNARRFAREHNAALTLQTSLLPPELPGHSAVQVAYRYLPADAEAGVGGDWFDVIPLSGVRVALVVGDVVGHGIHAAASMGRLRAAVQTLADLDLPPDELLTHVDDLVVRLADEAEAATDGPQVMGATCVYAVYDPISRKLSVARAGHPSPAVAHLDEPVEFPDIPAGPPLGLGGLPFESVEFDVEEGSVIALYTDGLIEACDRDVDVGFERLCFALAHPDQPLEEICDTMVRTLLPDHPHDDVAFLIARTRSFPPDQVASWEVPADPSAVHEVRENTARRLDAWGLDDLAFTTELIASELVTNAIRHACGPIGLRLIRDRTLICEVSDGGNTSPHMRRAHTTDEGGRGLFLVAQLAQRWGTRYTATGKTIWAEQLIPPSHTAT